MTLEHRMAYIIRLLITWTLLFAAPALAQNNGVSDSDLFKLWNNCKKISLIVEDLSEDATEIGLTKENIEISVRSRLRGGRMYTEDNWLFLGPYLYVNSHVVGSAFSLQLHYIQFLVRPELDGSIPETDAGIFSRRGFAVTWDTASTGKHGGDSNYILSSIAGSVDKFIDEYLRVNADACS